MSENKNQKNITEGIALFGNDQSKASDVNKQVSSDQGINLFQEKQTIKANEVKTPLEQSVPIQQTALNPEQIKVVSANSESQPKPGFVGVKTMSKDVQVQSMPRQNDSPIQPANFNIKTEGDGGLKIEFTPANAQADLNANKSFAVKKTPEQIKIENEQAQLEKVNATGSESINSKLGVFTKRAEIKSEPVVATKLETEQEQQPKEEKSKIRLNFEKFNQKRKNKTIKTSKFGEKVSIMLRSKKGLKWTWIIELSVIAIMLIVGIVSIVLISPNISQSPAAEWVFLQGVGMATIVFSYITTCSWAIPALFLLTAWFIGINDVIRSKGFHYLIWGIGAINLLLFLVQISTGLTALVSVATFH